MKHHIQQKSYESSPTAAGTSLVPAAVPSLFVCPPMSSCLCRRSSGVAA